MQVNSIMRRKRIGTIHIITSSSYCQVESLARAPHDILFHAVGKGRQATPDERLPPPVIFRRKSAYPKKAWAGAERSSAIWESAGRNQASWSRLKRKESRRW
jgi:hypothetical protein